MKAIKILFVFVIVMFVLFTGCAKQVEKVGNAPPEAFLEGSKYPYFGSEDNWDRRFFTEHIVDFYKRRGQRQMLDIVEGKPAEAIAYCRELLAGDPDDLEALFNLAVAQTVLNDLDAAIEVVKEAVGKGLPVGRFLAGPRELLKPLTESRAFRNYADGFDVRLIHGPMVGCVTDRTAKFWVRTVDEAAVQIVASTSKRLYSPIRSEVKKTKSEDDFTVVLEIDGLRPDTEYYYDVVVSGKFMLRSDVPSFKTYVSKGKPYQFSIAFGGGAGYVPQNERMWDVIDSKRPSALFLMGDNVYINMPTHLNGVHYYTYYRRQSRPEYRRLTSKSCVYAIWDDHDCATDDVWMGPYRDKPSWKMEMFDLFEQNWVNPGYGDPEWPGCWFDVSIGDVDFIFLEGRFYRTNPYAPNPTLLGPVQKKWLLETLKQSTGTFKVLVSPVPWALASKGGAIDTWNGFRDERNEIFDFLAENKIEGVILLSADRHRSDIWKMEYDIGYPLYEFESSRLTNQHVAELVPEAIFGYNEKPSFGLLKFDTTITDPTVTYEIVSIDDELIHTFEIKKSDVSFQD